MAKRAMKHERTIDPRIDLLLDLLDWAYVRKGWHGANLRGSIRGLTAVQAAWRPRAGRKSIAEQTLHTAYWKYTVRRRLLGEKRGSFPLKGSNWFPVDAGLSEQDWRGFIRLLDEQHAALRDAVAALPPAQLKLSPDGGKVSNEMLICGIASHDLYHTGQIQLLKRLQDEGSARG